MDGEALWKPPRVQLDSSRPLYEQFADIVRADIANQSLLPGQRLPSVRDLAAHFRVNPNTVMRTYQDLEREGFIVTFRGQGTFVASDERVIEESRRSLAVAAVAQLKKVAEAMGLTIEDVLKLANESRGDES